MEENAECMLVMLGATPQGRKELIGFQVGLRESAQSWHELLTDIKGRGLSVPPEIAVGPCRAICYANALPGNGQCHGVLERAGQDVPGHKAPTLLPSWRCTHRLPCDRCIR
jgi:hypothetical protein